MLGTPRRWGCWKGLATGSQIKAFGPQREMLFIHLSKLSVLKTAMKRQVGGGGGVRFGQDRLKGWRETLTAGWHFPLIATTPKALAGEKVTPNRGGSQDAERVAAPCSAAAGRARKKGERGKNELSPPSTGTGTSGSGAGGFVTTRGVLGKASSERPHAFNSADFGQTWV